MHLTAQVGGRLDLASAMQVRDLICRGYGFVVTSRLPLWVGCRRLQRGELFLLGTRPDSLDGRYFGPLPASGLIGTAHPVATRNRPGAPLRWRPRCCTCRC